MTGSNPNRLFHKPLKSLKKHVERTYPPPVRAPAGPATGGAKELVAEVYPADKPYRDVADEKDVKRGKRYYEAAEHVLNARVAGSTTLVSDMSLSLADNASADEMKNAQGIPRRPQA